MIKKENIYEVGYSDWEDFFRSVLYHPTVFSKEEYWNILSECFIKANEILKLEHEKNMFENPITEEEEKHNQEWGGTDYRVYDPQISYLTQEVVKIMVSDYGFTELSSDTDRYFYPATNGSPITGHSTLYNQDEDEEFNYLKNLFTKIMPRQNSIESILSEKDQE